MSLKILIRSLGAFSCAPQVSGTDGVIHIANPTVRNCRICCIEAPITKQENPGHPQPNLATETHLTSWAAQELPCHASQWPLAPALRHRPRPWTAMSPKRGPLCFAASSFSLLQSHNCLSTWLVNASRVLW